jgi:membrane-associated phospholipid phosphatase
MYRSIFRVPAQWKFLFERPPRAVCCIFLIAYTLYVALTVVQLLEGSYPNLCDRKVTAWVYQRPVLRGPVAQALTDFGDSNLLRKLSGLGVVILLMLRRWNYVPPLLIGIFGEMWFTHELQNIFGRSRPDFPDGPHIGRPGFHSGHTSSATTFFVFWIYLLIVEYKGSRLTKVLTPILGVIVVSVGVTRISLLAHWITDVVAGFCFGICWIFVCIWINERMQTQFVAERCKGRSS